MIDCSITENYLKEKARMTDHCAISCGDCILGSKNNDSSCSCYVFEEECTEKAIEIVQKWSDEHPHKTYKQDFLEKFPNALVNKDGDLYCCRKNTYGQKQCPDGLSCTECWNEAAPEKSYIDIEVEQLITAWNNPIMTTGAIDRYNRNAKNSRKRWNEAMPMEEQL